MAQVLTKRQAAAAAAAAAAAYLSYSTSHLN